MGGNSGNAISFVGGLSEGYMKGQDIKRQREKEAKDDERQARQDAIAEQDRALRNQEAGLRIQQTELSLQGAQKKRKQEEDETQRAAYEAGMRQRLAPLITGGNHRQALAEIERANNEDPYFNDGTVTEFEKGQDGLPAIDANGQVKIRVLNKTSGAVIGEASVKPEDAYVSFFNRLQSPAEYNKRMSDAAAKHQEEAAAAAKREADLADYKQRQKIATDERIRLTNVEAGLGVKGRKGGTATREERLVKLYRSMFPKETEEQIYKRVNAGRTKDPKALRVDLIKSYMASNYGATYDEAKANVDKAFPELLENEQRGASAQASGTAADLARELGIKLPE